MSLVWKVPWYHVCSESEDVKLKQQHLGGSWGVGLILEHRCNTSAPASGTGHACGQEFEGRIKHLWSKPHP